jgi:SAM-dependent methyltransferase
MTKSIISGGLPKHDAPPPLETPPPLPTRFSAWEAWLASPPGRYVLEWEHARFDEAVGDVFGFHAVQLGLPGLDCLRANRMPHRIGVTLPADPTADSSGGRAAPAVARAERAGGSPHSSVLVEHFEELPFDSQSIDLVVLPHVLEFAADPHQVLREVDRILRPEGRVIISGFNPVSLWGVRQLALRRLGGPFLPTEGQFIAVPRLRDWFKLLSFEMDGGRYGCYRPPCRTQLWLDRTRFMEKAGDRWWPICGAVYMVSAVKRVRGMRLLGPAWKRQRTRSAVAVVAPQRRVLRTGLRPPLRLVVGAERRERSADRRERPVDDRGEG